MNNPPPHTETGFATQNPPLLLAASGLKLTPADMLHQASIAAGEAYHECSILAVAAKYARSHPELFNTELMNDPHGMLMAAGSAAHTQGYEHAAYPALRVAADIAHVHPEWFRSS